MDFYVLGLMARSLLSESQINFHLPSGPTLIIYKSFKLPKSTRDFAAFSFGMGGRS